MCLAAWGMWVGTSSTAHASDVEEPADLRRLYGQLLIVGFIGTEPGEPGVEAAARDLRDSLAGGVIFFDRNIAGWDQLTALSAYFRDAAAPHPPFLALDEEGGAVQRLRFASGFRFEPSARWVAGNMTPGEARKLYRLMAGEIAAVGLNLNFAPVVDLDIQPGNSIIGRLGRSFGDDPEQVARFAGAFIDAHRAKGVLTALKHWPGHGSSRGDPHYTTAKATGAWQAKERLPFQMLIKAAKADMIMSGHLHHESWSAGNGLPASLSPQAVGVELRQTLGFDGVVVTDDIQMGSALAGRTLAEAIVLALAAGNDIVLIGNMLEVREDAARHAIEAIDKAVADGRLDLEALKASYRRVMALKQRIKR